MWSETVKTISERVQVKHNPEDYIKDGLLYCGKCHTPKQVEIEVCGERMKPFCLCQCEEEKKAEEEKAFKSRLRAARVKRLRDAGFVEADLKECRFDMDDGKSGKVIEVAKKYCENFAEMYKAGKGLMIYGSTGVGKTFAAACIANELIDKGRPVKMTNFSTVRNELMATFEKQDVIDDLMSYDLLIIDDLAAEGSTEYMNEVVQNIIDARYRSGKPLIITTNLTAEELKNPRSINRKRTLSRLYEMCLPVEAKGKDRRRKVMRESVDKYSAMLGLEETDG